MTIKIDDLNEALQRIHAAIELVGKLKYQSEDSDLVELLKDSQGILECEIRYDKRR